MLGCAGTVSELLLSITMIPKRIPLRSALDSSSKLSEEKVYLKTFSYAPNSIYCFKNVTNFLFMYNKITEVTTLSIYAS